MAAYAFLLSLEQVLEKILRRNHTHVHEKQNIQSLHEKVILLQQFLGDCPEKIKIFEGRIRDAANEAQYIIELDQSEAIGEERVVQIHHVEKQIESDQSKAIESEKRTNQIFRLISCCVSNVEKDNVFSSERVVQIHHVEKQIEELDCVIKEVIEMKKSVAKEEDRSSVHSSYSSASSSRVSPLSKDTPVVGFEADMLDIKDRLCGSSKNLLIVPIVGMGGIGKTTLAKNAYEDPLIVQHFDVRAWETVSQDYHAREILQGLLRSITKSNERFEQNDELLREMIHKSLKRRRYLIVMDDMWSTNVFDDMRRMFPDDCNGSRIVVTTRLSDVAVYTNDDDSSLVHKMRLMDEDRSWKLLQRKVFGQESCPLELEEIGKMVARNCRGLPIAIVVIGGILSKVDRTQNAWRKIEKSVGRVVNTSDMPFRKILSLSYDHLPHRLRPCFLYLGGFPEDYEIHISSLIKLWVAEGLLKPSRSKSLEEVAKDNLKDLLNRNLILDGIRKRSNGQIRTIKIHDLLRDMCLEKAQEEEFIILINYEKCYMKSCVPRSIHADLKRTDYPRIDADERLFYCLQHFKLLWVLNMFSITFKGFPTEVVQLFHLRYDDCWLVA